MSDIIRLDDSLPQVTQIEKVNHVLLASDYNCPRGLLTARKALPTDKWLSPGVVVIWGEWLFIFS